MTGVNFSIRITGLGVLYCKSSVPTMFSAQTVAGTLRSGLLPLTPPDADFARYNSTYPSGEPILEATPQDPQEQLRIKGQELAAARVAIHLSGSSSSSRSLG